MILHNLGEGFPLEDPPVLIPWGLSRKNLCELLKPHGLKQTSPETYEIACTAFNGLVLKLHLRFDERRYRDKKYLLSFHRVDECDLLESFEDFQRHLEETLGTPTTTKPGEEGYPDYQWKMGIYTVFHGVYEYHVLRESVMISPPYIGPAQMEQLFDLFSMLFQFIILQLAIPILFMVAAAIFLISRLK